MNARSYKTVFSKRLGTLVAVGEHASSQGKANGASVGVGFAGIDGFATAIRYVGTLTASFALVSLVWAGPVTTVAPTALPTGGQVAQGAASISQSGAVMNINQSTAKAVVNWNTFDIGRSAKVNIVQPGADAVMLNRVSSANPSQILGQLSANGQVVLVNPNGVLFGKDGSVNASSFTASTLGISDANFMAGNMHYERNGSTAGVVNQGAIKTSGGYVALLGASVSNEGQIQTQGGTAYLAAAEAVKIPVSGSGRIQLALSPSSINAAVANAKGGTIVTEGGQVYMQAAALNSAVASIIQSGSIDTTGEQGGAVHVLAEGGTIKVDGRITANSTGQDEQGQQRKGGDIVIGRDETTAALAKSTDVGGAQLQSKGGFVETSGEQLKTDGIQVMAKDWLLDPSDITISSGADAGYAESGSVPTKAYTPTSSSATSVVNVTTLQTAINAGTSVTIATTNTGTSGSGAGNITIANALSFNNTGAQDATLTLNADNGIIQNAAITATGSKLVNISMTANGNYQGIAAASANSKGISLNAGITTNGALTLNGTNKTTTTGFGVDVNAALSAASVSATGTASTDIAVRVRNTIASTSGAISLSGTSATGSSGVYISSNVTSAGNVTVNGTATTGAAGVGAVTQLATLSGQAVSLTGTSALGYGINQGTGATTSGTAVTFNGSSTSASGDIGVRLNGTIAATTSMDVTGTSAKADGIYATGTNFNGGTTADVTINGTATNGSGFFSSGTISGGIVTTSISGKNITINGTANATTSGTGVRLVRDNTTTIAAANNLAITGTVNGTGTGSGINTNGSNVGSAILMTAGGTATLKGIQRGNANNTSDALYLSGFRVNATGDVTIQAEAANSNSRAINMSREAGGLTGYDDGWRLQVRSTNGNVLIQSNQGAVLGQDTGAGVNISGKNVTLDNTGAGMTVNGVANANGGSIDTTTGAIVLGSGTSSYAASSSNAWAGAWVPLGVSLGLPNGAASSTSGITATGNLTIGGSSSAAQGAAVGNSMSVTGNINLASRSSKASTNGLDITQALTAGGNINLTGESTNATPGVGMNVGAEVKTTGTASATTMTSTTGAVSGTGNITTAVGNAGTITVSTATAGTLSGVISGGGSLVKQGPGTSTLTGTNTYTGTTTISAGTLQVGNGGTTGSLGTGAVTNNANVTFNRSNAMTVSNAISGTGAVNQIGAGTTTLTADNTYTGTTTISGGTLQIGNGGSTGTLGSGDVTLVNGSGLVYNRGADTTINNNISGNGNVTAAITGNLDVAKTINLSTSGNTVNLTASNSITESAGSISATNLYLTATAGSIGSSANRISSNVTNLAMTSTGDQFTSQVNALNLAAKTTGNGNIDVQTTHGTLTITSVNGVNGVTTIGAAGDITLVGNANAGRGMSINQAIASTNGNVNLTGTTASTVNGNAGIFSSGAVSAKNITMVASATAATGNVLGYYGGGGTFNASQQLSLTGNSVNANGLYTYTGGFTSGTGMTLTGTSVNGSGVGIDNNVTITNTGSGGITITGTASTSRDAIGMRGVAIANSGGDVVWNAITGHIVTSVGDYSAWNVPPQTNTIINSGTGKVQITAGNGSTSNSGAIDGSVFTITQNGNAGVVVSTSGTGNLMAPKVINAGTGNIVLAAGSAMAAGTGTGGQVLTVVGNTVVQTNVAPGKTYVYSGAPASTGVLSNLTVGFSSLYYEGTGSPLNAAFNQAYGATLAGGASAQVLFREGAAPAFNLDLSSFSASKTYGQADPNVLAAIQTSFTGTNLTRVIAGVGGNNTFAVSANEFLATLTGGRAAGENASLTPYAYSLSAGLNTNITAQPALTINKALITVVMQGLVQKEYDGTTAASVTSANYNVTGWVTVGGVTEGATLTQPLATYASHLVANNPGTGLVSTSLQVSNFTANAGTNLANYTLPSSASGNVGLITRAPLTVKVNNTAMFVTQDPNTAFDQGFTAGVNQLKNGETLAGVLGTLTRTYTGAANPAAGNHSAVYDLSTVPAAANYTVTVQKGDLAVARADQLLLNVGSTSATYGAVTASNAGASATSVSAQYCLVSTNCNGTNIANLTMSNQGAGHWTATDAANSTISFNTVADTAGRISGAGFVNTGNYTYTTANLTTTGTVNFNGTVVSGGVLTVDPKALSLNASNVTKVYDGTTALAGLALTPTGALAGDQISVTSSGGTFGGKNVGSQSFSLTGLQLQGADRANYTFASNSVTGTGSITPKTLTLSATAQDKVYDGTASASVGALSVSGAIAGDTVSATGGTASFSDKNVARDASGRVIAKAVTISGVTLTGADAGNYQAASGASVTASITPLTVNASVTAQNKVYDGTTQAQVSGTVAGTLGVDAVSVTSTSSTFASKNVVRDAAGRATSQSVNVAGLTLSGADAVNYNLASTTATSAATITPKVLNASGAVADKVYDGSAQASLTGLSGAGIVAGDAVSVQASSAAFSDKNVARDASGNVIGKTVTVTGLSIGGADANNYELMGSSFTAQASILPRSLSLVATAQDKVYDASTAATGSVSASNIVAGDALQLSWTPGQFASKDVSRNAQGQTQAQGVSFANVQMSGADVGNYSLGSGTASTTATITPKVLSVVGTLVGDKPEDGNTTAKVTMGTVTGLVGQEQLQVSAAGNFQSASVGSGKPVDVNYSLRNGPNGGKADNYVAPSQVLRASITASSKSNPLQPVILPATTGSNSPQRVVVVRAQAAVADLESKNESRQACSFLSPEKCACEETAVQGVEMCVTPPEVASRTPQDRVSSLALPLSR